MKQENHLEVLSTAQKKMIVNDYINYQFQSNPQNWLALVIFKF